MEVCDFRRISTVFHRRNQYRPSVFISFSIFMAFSKSPSIRSLCSSVLFCGRTSLDIRIYYLVWHLHFLHCRDIVEPFGATSKNVFRSISRSYRSYRGVFIVVSVVSFMFLFSLGKFQFGQEYSFL